MATSSTLSQTQRYAAGALLAFALRQAQIHQRVLLGSHGLDEDADPNTAVVSSADPDGRDLWTHDSRGLLLPVLRFLEIDPKAWPGVEKTAATSDPKHHIGAFLRKVFEDEDDGEKAAADRSDLEFALAKAVDAMAMGLENDVAPGDLFKQQVLGEGSNNDEQDDEGSPSGGRCSKDYRKMAVLYMLLSACVADVNMAEDGTGSPRIRKGYDARHRVALRLLATWLDVKWIKMEAIEIMVACSAMAAAKEEEQSRECVSPRSRWQNWKRGGIIGAAALTGGTLMAISGGLAAPAIAAGFSALAPTLHALVPVIGASGFAAMATAAGHTAGSVAVAASFGGVALELVREGAMQTVLSGIISAFAWPATIITAAEFIDKGIVERAVLIGAPVSVQDELWEPARKMVAGRLVNVYSTNDWILGVTFRASLLTQGLAGIQAIQVPGVENVDVSDLVVGHSSYLGLMQQILEQLELNTYYPVFSPSTPRSK
ncbi:hypothetical protein ACQ4PT_028815 [Festuca glaucescens]